MRLAGDADRMRQCNEPKHLLLWRLILGIFVVIGAWYWLDLNAILTADEAFTWRAIDLSYGRMVQVVAADASPPLHYILLKGWADLFGHSIVPLRCFSVLAALGSVFLIGSLAEWGERSIPAATSMQCACVIAPLFLALSANFVAQAAISRYYPLALLTALTSQIFLLRALECNRGWIPWGITLGISMLVHHFALFTAIAQLCFVVSIFCNRLWKTGWNGASPIAYGTISGTCALGAVYSWWLPLFLQQAKEVQESFWIPPVNADGVLGSLAYLTWSIHWSAPRSLFWLGCIAFVLVSIIAMRPRRYEMPESQTGAQRLSPREVDLFFLMQFVIPFGLCIGISYLSERTILQCRYLLMAEAGWVCLLARQLCRIEPARARVGVCTAICALAIAGIWLDRDYWSRMDQGRHDAMNCLMERTKAGDLVLTSRPSDLNVCKYYLGQVGGDKPDVRLLGFSDAVVTKGHKGHIAVLTSDDVLWSDDANRLAYRSIWVWQGEQGPVPPVPFGYELVQRRSFDGADGAFILLEYRQVR